MTLPASPPISMDQVYAEFSAPVGTPLHAFVRGGSYVPNIGANGGVPTAPPVTLHQLCGASAYQPPVISGPNTVAWSGTPGGRVINWHTTSGQSVSGGNPSKTYSWVRISGSAGIVCDVANTLAGDWYGSTGRDFGNPIPPSTISAVWRLTVNDGQTAVTKDVNFVFTDDGTA